METENTQPSSPSLNTPTSPEPTEPQGSLPFRTVFILILLILTLGAGYYFYDTYASQKNKPTYEMTPESNSMVISSDAMFATYQEKPSTVKPSLQAYTLKSSELSNLTEVATAAKFQFSPDQLSTLESSGFFTQLTTPPKSDPNETLNVTGNRSDDMVDLYKTIGGAPATWDRKPENAVFVSSDFLLHIFHVLVDRSFQKIEQDKFQPKLGELTNALFIDALSHYNAEQDPALKESWKRLTVYYLVPNVLLKTGLHKPKEYFGGMEEQEEYLKNDENSDSAEGVQKALDEFKASTSPEIYELAQQELNLIMKAEAFGVSSPLFGKLKPDSPEDYTQYSPRSHYAKNSVLRSYFRAMMWYSRQGFDVKSTELTRDALLMTWQLTTVKVGIDPALEVWQNIYQPTTFFVGKSDDLIVYDYAKVMSNIYGSSPTDKTLADESKLTEFQTEVNKLEGPKILSSIKTFEPNNAPTKDELLNSTKGFRFMGQRFIPDSYIFSSLTQGDEQPDPTTGQKLPSTPTALMAMSVLGSKEADTLLDDWIKTNAPDSDKVIAKVKGELTTEFQKLDNKVWTQNMYWAWLYNFIPLFEQHGDGYPMFMRNPAWSKKSLVTVLGSWTELRHDTLLYAKQSFAELGGGGGEIPPDPPVPKGYVEPNLSFLTRLIALTTMTRDGLDNRHLLINGQKEKFDSYLETLEFFKTIAEKELANETISDDDYEKLRTIIRNKYPNIVWTPNGEEMTEKDARVGIIADVHTDAKKGQILYEAVGAPSIIYVAVKDKGGTRLTRGVTYSYYEFTSPISGTRLNDQTWQGMIYEEKDTGKMPAPPTWTQEIVK